jgi:putative transposase
MSGGTSVGLSTVTVKAVLVPIVLEQAPHEVGIQTILTPVQALKANAIAERLVGTLRRECLDHLIIVDERHLRLILMEYAAYYNAARPHRALDLQPPNGASVRAAPPTAGRLRARPVLGGLHHEYEWKDA